MVSADFSQQLLAMLHTLFPHVCETSHGKTHHFHSIYRHHLHKSHPCSLWDFVLFGKLVLQLMPDDVRVPPAGTLPPASFRFHLAMDTLALG